MQKLTAPAGRHGKPQKQEKFETQTMLLLLDTEFTDILNPELISLGLVSADGRYEFYAELTDFNRRACTRFVWKEVLPKLGQIPAAKADRATVAAAFTAWLAELPSSIVEIGFDFDGDWSLIEPLIGAEVRDRCVPRHIWRFIMTDNLPPKLHTAAPTQAHHALWDAHVLRLNWLAANAIANKTVIDE